jgi:hypothetical protein
MAPPEPVSPPVADSPPLPAPPSDPVPPLSDPEHAIVANMQSAKDRFIALPRGE